MKLYTAFKITSANENKQNRPLIRRTKSFEYISLNSKSRRKSAFVTISIENKTNWETSYPYLTTPAENGISLWTFFAWLHFTYGEMSVELLSSSPSLSLSVWSILFCVMSLWLKWPKMFITVAEPDQTLTKRIILILLRER